MIPVPKGAKRASAATRDPILGERISLRIPRGGRACANDLYYPRWNLALMSS